MTDEDTTVGGNQSTDLDTTHPAKRLAEARKQAKLALNDDRIEDESAAHDAAELTLQAAILAERLSRGGDGE